MHRSTIHLMFKNEKGFNMYNRKDVKRFAGIAAGLLSAMVVSMPGTIVENKGFAEMLLNEVDGVGLLSFIVAVALSIWYWKNWDVLSGHKHWTVHVLASLFSVFTLIGKSYTQLGNWDFIFYNGRQFVIAIIAFVGHFILYELCIFYLFRFLDSKRIFFQYADTKSEGIIHRIEEHYFIFAFIVISICWLPYLIILWPGSVPHDGYRQILMAFGVEPLSNCYPWVLTVVIGGLMRVGRLISDNAGVSVIVLTFFIVQAGCYAFVCNRIKQWKAPRVFNAAVLILFSIVPVFGVYAQAVLKDGIFTAFVLLFMTLYADCCLSCLNIIPETNKKRQMLLLFVTGFMVCLTRTNGIYIVLPASILLFFFLDKGKRRYALVLTIVLLVSNYGVNKKLPSVLNIEQGSAREALSIPFQQTARYFKEYPDDITDAELEAIAAVLQVDGLAERYVPQLSDPVKDRSYIASDQSLGEYFNAWHSMFQRHPGVYAEAALHNMYGYFYPFNNECTRDPFAMYIRGGALPDGGFDIHYTMPEKVRNWVACYTQGWLNMPGLAQLLIPGFFSWVLFFICGYIIYSRQYKKLLLYVGPLVIFVGCIASPVNGYLRYAMPLLACMPVLAFFCLADSHSEEEMDDENSIKNENLGRK